MKQVPEELPIPADSRRSFVRNLALASAAAGVVPSVLDAQSTTISDVDILNFALNLEYLEAEFYTVATTGLTISSFGLTITGSGMAGATTGGQQVPFNSGNTLVKKVAQELAADERYHVALLQNTITSLGGTPIAKPAINLNALNGSGNLFATEAGFLTLSRIFEEIGVTAYGGAASLLSNKTVVGYAARILATEAEHVGFIRALINQYAVSVTALDSVDVIPPPAGPMYFSTNSSAITAIRSPAQVLYLAFATANATSGAFFPAGINGNAALGTSSATAAVTDGVTFTLTPNPVTPVSGLGTVTVTWACPSTVQYIEVRIGSPNGALFTVNTPTGSMATGAWVTDGMLFYLQDVTYPKNNSLTAANTLAVAIARLVGS